MAGSSNQQIARLALFTAQRAAAGNGLGLVAVLAASVAITQTAFDEAQASVSVNLEELGDAQAGVWLVEESWIVSGGIASTFRSKLTVGPDADPLVNHAGMFQSIPASVNDAVIFHRSTRVLFRPEGGGFLVSVSGSFVDPDGVTVTGGEVGPDDPVQEQTFTIPGNIVIGSVSRFDSAGSQVTLQQFTVTRIG